MTHTNIHGRNIMKTLLLVVMALLFAGMTSVVAQTKAAKKKPAFAMKELKAFHDVLHPLVHDALPKSDFGRIRGGLEKLLEKAKAIQAAKLPKPLEGRSQEFENVSESLVAGLEDMVSMKDKVDDATIEKLFNEMHDTFEQLVEITR